MYLNKHWILEEVEKMFSEFGADAINPYNVIKSSDIDLIETELGNKTLGQTIRNKRCYAILINQSLSSSMKEFILWHEIAHVRLHKGISTAAFRTNNLNHMIYGIEAEANAFAIAMLIKKIDECDLTHMSSFQIIEYLGLPHTLEHLVLHH
ncbi:ImmA/IrrE family metallo-endopeptidase [Enterococcus faecalis]|uniref:ImmA/IrrE family metallo-endopeptidase n=1 Tax=Enterococcus faecalis TaxID=1351 RepID=UPI00192208E7|nr:ImmA/IrrE family metallo-endopeptidase [Enterococcus faecalis]EGO7983255.1 ImmA/IrrE family metallo-endopeptidase [Enterococcus faecalis]EJR1551037.1 ImmA/IrrE family metallo-endopeptidase [Enterococcus faecalis]EJY7246285.1 ImmA/IrrE family metallo-endopeptidase [Enterococcus faecalis]EKE4871659.1 ImmA/IrrE family metallo-endopeptidase [Enterococcus faecalis]EKZ0465615.1 ImmA/IrrE family metallo-endopeptidase [Enterococcus faecalis]